MSLCRPAPRRRAAGAARALLLLVLFGPGCGAAPGRESIPYQFRQSLLAAEGEARSAPPAQSKGKRAHPAKERAARPALGARCRQQVGARFSAPRDQARLALIQACLGRPLSAGSLLGERQALHKQRPRPGNLVFFHNTRDRNANGKLDDELTEVGVVVEVHGSLVEFIYLRQLSCEQPVPASRPSAAGSAQAGTAPSCPAAVGAAGVLNLDQPHRRRLRGRRVQNSYLRIIQPGDAPATPYLAGQLLAGFAPPPRR